MFQILSGPSKLLYVAIVKDGNVPTLPVVNINGNICLLFSYMSKYIRHNVITVTEFTLL